MSEKPKPFIVIKSFGAEPKKMNLTEAKEYAKAHFKRNKDSLWHKQEWGHWILKDLDKFDNFFKYLEINGLIDSTNLSEFTYSTGTKKWTLKAVN